MTFVKMVRLSKEMDKKLGFFYKIKTTFEIENSLWKLKIHQFEVAGVMSIQNSAISFKAS